MGVSYVEHLTHNFEILGDRPRSIKITLKLYSCFLVSFVEINLLASTIFCVIRCNIAMKVLETMLALVTLKVIVTLNLFEKMTVIETIKNLTILAISHSLILLQLLVIY